MAKMFRSDVSDPEERGLFLLGPAEEQAPTPSPHWNVFRRDPKWKTDRWLQRVEEPPAAYDNRRLRKRD